MLVGGRQWSDQIDAFCASVGAKSARSLTRKCAGGQSGGFTSWASLFENVGTEIWMTCTLGWTERNWIILCKDVC
eukprot:7072147-Pyramimonas_sp.AAC.1